MTDPTGLRRAYEADSWPRPEPGAQQVLVWRFRFHGIELDGWRTHRVQYAQLAEQTSAVFSVWQPTREAAGALLLVNVFETPSAADAREWLLRLLGEVQGPRMARIDGAGEIAFGAGQLLVVFIRANVVVQVSSAERVEVAVGDVARRLDKWLSAVPDAGGPAAPASQLRASRDPAGKGIRITAEPAEPATGGPWYKLVVRGATVRAEPSGVLITPAPPATQEVTVFVVDQAGHTTRALLQLP